MKRLLLAAILAPVLMAQAPAGPKLEAGEALAVGSGERQVAYGDVSQEHPMGHLAKLVWLRAEGAEWTSRELRFKCTGEMAGVACTKKGGHGREDVGAALRDGCDLAFLAWGRWSVQRWVQESGEGSAEPRLEELFHAFLGRRMPQTSGPVVLGRAWVGEDPLLRTTPKLMLDWLMDPVNEGLTEQAMRFLRPFGGLLSQQGKDWWIYPAGAWVVGSDGQRFAVLRLPKAEEPAAGKARFKAVMGLK